MSASVRSRAIAVHFDRDGTARCGNPRAKHLTAVGEDVTCRSCAGILAGTFGGPGGTGGRPWYDVKPCGTPAAYRRHLRREGKPVRCLTCLRAEARRNEDRRQKRDLRRAA